MSGSSWDKDTVDLSHLKSDCKKLLGEVEDMKPIAVITSSPTLTFQWLKNTKDVVSMNIAQMSITDREGDTYIVIDSKQKALAWEFSNYIIDYQNYESLDDIVRTRIR